MIIKNEYRRIQCQKKTDILFCIPTRATFSSTLFIIDRHLLKQVLL